MDSDIAVEDSAILEDPFQNMKVAELKKELKARGLSVTGTKPELLERLRSDHAKESGLSPATNDDEDEILNDVTEELKTDAAVISDDKASKKNDSGIVEKKISLNRTTKINLPINVIVNTVETKDTSQEPPKSESGSKRNISSVKAMSAQERLAMRAQRFNVTADSETTLKTVSNDNSLITVSKYKMVKSPAEQPNVEILRKRAERFGENVSSIMKQMEAKEKVLKRKLRFGVSPAALSTVGSGEEDRKRLRAQRFNLS